MKTLTMAAAGAVRFVNRQKRNYRVALTRQAINSFLANLTMQYNSIYVAGLGASPVELGGISSVASAVGALVSLPVGWLVDRYSLKKVWSLGVLLVAVTALMYALAPTWHLIIVATIVSTLAMRLTGTGCGVISADSVPNEDRVTAQNVCVTLASLASMAAPVLAAFLIARAGGLTVEGIRPLYWLQFVGYAFVFYFVVRHLEEPRHMRGMHRPDARRFVADFRQLFHTGTPLKRWTAVALLTSLPMAATAPFFQLYAHEFKQADERVLALMATSMILTRLAFGIPLGRLADRIGRKKIIYLLTPLWYGSFILLVLATNSYMLIAAAALQTFYNIAMGATGAMTLELVPVEVVGRWRGLLGLLNGLVAIPAPLLGGVIYRHWGAHLVFLIPIAIDLLFRLPLFATVPETLHGQQLMGDEG